MYFKELQLHYKVIQNFGLKLSTMLRLTNVAKAFTKIYFKKPIIENQFQVTPSLFIPQNIQRPQYLIKKNNQYASPNSTQNHSKQTIQKLRLAAKLVSQILGKSVKFVKEGITGHQLDKFIHEQIVKLDAYPSGVGFYNFPKSVCISPNEVLCHGIPNLRPLDNGDILNIDITLYKDGVFGDNSMMAVVGQVDKQIQHLIFHTRQSVYQAIKKCGQNQKINAIGKTIEEYASKHGLHVCRFLQGHGIGDYMHMPPAIQSFCNLENKAIMKKGMVFTIEPILTLKRITQIVRWKDDFTLIAPNNPSAQFEHMILITQDGCQVLTKRPQQNI